MFFQQRHWTHHIASVFSVLVRGAPCAVLRWCFPDNLNDRSFEGASFNFVALARLQAKCRSTTLARTGRGGRAVFRSVQWPDSTLTRQTGARPEAARRPRRVCGAVAHLVLQQTGCAGNEVVTCRCPELILAVLWASRLWATSWPRLPGHWRRCCGTSFLWRDCRSRRSCRRSGSRQCRRGGFWKTQSVHVVDDCLSVPRGHATRAAPVHAPLSVMVCLAAGTRPDDESACWIDPLDAFTGGMTHGAAANSIVPALRADGGGGRPD